MMEAGLNIAMANRPFPGEKNSGDLPLYYQNESSLLLGIVDGLGHGEKAYNVGLQIKNYLDNNWHTRILELFTELNEAIKFTIGAAIGLCHIELSSGMLSYASIGNTRGYLLGRECRSFVCNDGVVGHNMRTPLLQNQVLQSGDKVVLISDGIHERFYNNRDNRMIRSTPNETVEIIMEKYGKMYDDASCLVYGY